jgi:hypothetical protein
MRDVYLERILEPNFRHQNLDSEFGLPPVAGWQESLIDADRERVLSRYRVPEPSILFESLTRRGMRARAIWSGTLRRPATAPAWSGQSVSFIDVVAEFEPSGAGTPDTIPDECALCFKIHGIDLIQSFVADDRSRVISIFRAPDAESIRLAYRHAAYAPDRVWPCTRLLRDESTSGTERESLMQPLRGP